MILAFQIDERVPLLFGHNRDERRDRPARGPSLFSDEEIPIFAPQDLEARGTWMGLNARGVSAAITNRFGDNVRPGVRSRGELVFEALRRPDARRAADAVAALEPSEHYNGFHLLIADREHAELLYNDERGLHRRRLEPGVHVVTEQSFGAGPDGRALRLEREISAREGLDLESLAELLSVRAAVPLDGTIVDIPEMRYGTRASALVQLAAEPERSELRYADGPPDRTSYRRWAFRELWEPPPSEVEGEA
jgi:uncharacterized protein with NRDE domain